jgi:hypothetical protein
MLTARLDRFIAEVVKCQLLCDQCHRDITELRRTTCFLEPAPF